MEYASNAWLFFAVSIPLTLFTITVWYTWANSRRIYTTLVTVQNEKREKLRERIESFKLMKRSAKLPR